MLAEDREASRRLRVDHDLTALVAAGLWWLYFDSATRINLKILDLSGGSPTMAKAIFAVGRMLPALALLITAAGVGLLLPDPPRLAYRVACIGTHETPTHMITFML